MRSLFFISAITALTAGHAFAGDNPLIVLADRNSSATFNLTGPTAGQQNWILDGENRLKLQGFWFRTPGMNREENTSTLSSNAFLSDTNLFIDDRDDTLTVTNANTDLGLRIETTWTLRGSNAGGGRSNMNETIRITNTSRTAPLVISFFQFVDFDLSGANPNGAPNPDVSVAVHTALNNTVNQYGTGPFSSEEAATPAPDRWSVGNAQTLLALLTNDSVDDLDNTSGPVGPGDLAWAFQWNFTINPGDTRIISKVKSIVPAPGAAALLATGGLLIARRRRS